MKYATKRLLRMYADDCGWMVLHDDDRKLIVYRWRRDEQGNYRHEVCMIFDAADRLVALSQWHNRRQGDTDQLPGVRTRAEILLVNR